MASYQRTSGVVLIICLVTLSYFYDFHKIITLEPQSVHMWRQTDCLSFTKNYCEEDRGFFEPSIHHIGKPGTGKTVSDFPLIYFAMGRLWRITGQHEWIYRGFVLLLYFTAIFLIQRTLLKILKDPVYPVVLSLFLFTSPVLVYYSNNFLINLPAFSIILIAWHFFYRFYQSASMRFLWISFAFFALAGIFKASALLSFFALFGIYFLESTRLVRFKEEGKIFSQVKKSALPFAVVILLVAAWMTFVIQYNNANNRSYFLTGILPIWDFTWPEIMVKYREIVKHWIFFNFPGFFQVMIVLFWAIMMVMPSKNVRILYFLNLILAVGVVMFLLLFYQVIAGHDYYWIDLFILLFFTLFSFVIFLRRNWPAVYRWGKFAFAGVLIYNAIYCQKIIYDRYHGAPNNYYNEWLKDFSSAKPYLRSLGIDRTDYVISIPEGTINASLYLMDQKGWTTYGSPFEEEKFYYSRIARGAKYLMVSDSTFLQKEYLQPFIRNKIGQHKSISIFDLRGVEVPPQSE